MRCVAGHEGRVHTVRFPEQWRSGRVYVHELLFGLSALDIGTGYSTKAYCAYEVDPAPSLETDPERDGHLPTSRVCVRALVICCLHCPTASQEGLS